MATGYVIGDHVPGHFNGSIVAASYFASLCGCVLTIELLHRRGTALNNLRSWGENFACAVAFGVMGIWCMHFIGNRAIVMDDGVDELQLVYAPGFTTLSVFLPIIGLTLAFAAAEYPTKSNLYHWLALTGTGVFAGLSIVGMHYVGNMGIYNYDLAYDASYFTASIVIAVGDSLGVLVLFYTWRDKWISSVWKRIPCAIFLAGGVSAMHFTASVGCNYKLKSFSQPGALQTTNVQVIIASVLCGAAALTALGALFLTRYRIWSRRQKSKKIMLLCAIFDESGKILVTTEGVLPAHEITDKYNAANFSESFDVAHPVFQWIYRVSFNWSAVADLVSRMKAHVSKTQPDHEPHRPVSSASSAVYDSWTFSDYSIIFREQFCVAAATLANSLHIPLEKMGVLYDKIIETGTCTDERRSKKPISHDIEMGPRRTVVFGRGQALVLASQVSSEVGDRLLNAGYKFASIQNVGRSIADSMQVPFDILECHYNDLLRYVDNLENVEKPGTWLGFFACIPLAHSNGFDVAASKINQNQLPDAQIATGQLTPWQHQILLAMNGKKSSDCIRYLDNMQRVHDWSIVERQFASTVLTAFGRLTNKVPMTWWGEARFYAKALGAPYSRMLSGSSPPTALYNFVVIGDVHTTTDLMDSITKVPFSFFSARQRVVKFSRDHQILAREIHQEFGAILGRKIPHERPSSRFGLRNLKSSGKDTKKSTDVSVRGADSITTNESNETEDPIIQHAQPMVIEAGQKSAEQWENDTIYGGIMVDCETVIRTDSSGDLTAPGETVMGLGAVADVSRDKQEDTFADELLHVALHRFMPPKPGH